MFTCAICEEQYSPWSLSYQSRKGGKSICRSCKANQVQSSAVKTANKRNQNLISSVENRIARLEEEQKNMSFVMETAVKAEASNLDWIAIITPIVEKVIAEKWEPIEKEVKSMQKQLLTMHSRMKDLVEKRIWGED
jgi:K+-transporting ATPase c subunit